MLPLLLALVVLLAQTLVPTHRAAHPNAAARTASASVVSVAPGSALDLLFGHTSGAACDAFDAAFGHDFNADAFAPSTIVFAPTHAAPESPAAFLAASHPPGLFRARAPPQV